MTLRTFLLCWFGMLTLFTGFVLGQAAGKNEPYVINISRDDNASTSGSVPILIVIRRLSVTAPPFNEYKVATFWLSSRRDVGTVTRLRRGEQFAALLTAAKITPSEVVKKLAAEGIIELRVELEKLNWEDATSSSLYFIPFNEIAKGGYFLTLSFERVPLSSDSTQDERLLSNEIVVWNATPSKPVSTDVKAKSGSKKP